MEGERDRIEEQGRAATRVLKHRQERERQSLHHRVLEAQRRGYRLFHYLPQQLAYAEGKVSARLAPAVSSRSATSFADIGTRGLSLRSCRA